MGGLDRSGGCLCGAVRFTAKDLRRDYGACHCEMCRRWTGSVFLGITVPEGALTWEGSENIRRYQSSAWAERDFCRTCGSSLYYRLPGGDGKAEFLSLAAGTLDDLEGVTLTTEIYIANKPSGYAFAGDTKKMTEADVIAAFGGSAEG